MRRGLNFDAENDVILVNIDNPVGRVEGDLEMIAWVNGTIGH